MLSSAFCLKCKHLYDLKKRKVCTGTCTHSICEECYDKKLSGTCPTCEKEHAFDVKVINWAALDMTKELIESISISNMFDLEFDEKTVGEGPCSECKNLSKLRICADCAIQHGLLERSKDGGVELSRETSEEFLETKVLRIRSIALCSDCALDGGKHKGDGHNLIFITAIKNMKDTSDMLNFLSKTSLAIRKIKKGFEERNQQKKVLLYFSWNSEIVKTFERIRAKLEQRSKEDTSEDVQMAIQLFNTILDSFLNGYCYFYKKMSNKVLEITGDKMDRAESVQEKNELKQTMEKLQYFDEFFNSRASDFNISSSDVVNFIKCVGVLFESDETAEQLTYSEVVREIYDITGDMRKVIKLPAKYEKVANIAGSVLQLFMADKEKKVEDTDLD
ncbi:hypothetical protein CRE_16068 [Caenorhabditis remanei]|uniref:Uncharacterized protein n=1 Tax=Caenorhabditis remanei TaxID=31234 RepID=E3MBM8_CAERE|nr:hypothetical protein CRE_16068 [Caenorhabditis remanei]